MMYWLSEGRTLTGTGEFQHNKSELCMLLSDVDVRSSRYEENESAVDRVEEGRCVWQETSVL